MLIWKSCSTPIFLTNSSQVSTILVYLTDKKQNGHQKDNFEKKWKHNIYQIRVPIPFAIRDPTFITGN